MCHLFKCFKSSVLLLLFEFHLCITFLLHHFISSLDFFACTHLCFVLFCCCCFLLLLLLLFCWLFLFVLCVVAVFHFFVFPHTSLALWILFFMHVLYIISFIFHLFMSFVRCCGCVPHRWCCCTVLWLCSPPLMLWSVLCAHLAVSVESGDGDFEVAQDCDEEACSKYGGRCTVHPDGTFRCACNYYCDAVRLVAVNSAFNFLLRLLGKCGFRGLWMT